MQTKINDHDGELPYYDSKSKKLHGSQLEKARKLVKLDKVRPTLPNLWTIAPIEGYNTRHYEVRYDGTSYTCTCQFSTINLRICSHILAVMLHGHAAQEKGTGRADR